MLTALSFGILIGSALRIEDRYAHESKVASSHLATIAEKVHMNWYFQQCRNLQQTIAIYLMRCQEHGCRRIWRPSIFYLVSITPARDLHLEILSCNLYKKSNIITKIHYHACASVKRRYSQLHQLRPAQSIVVPYARPYLLCLSSNTSLGARPPSEPRIAMPLAARALQLLQR